MRNTDCRLLACALPLLQHSNKVEAAQIVHVVKEGEAVWSHLANLTRIQPDTQVGADRTWINVGGKLGLER